MFLAIALTAGGWLRDLLVRRLGGEDAEASVRERAGPMVERWGTAGFGLIGPVVIGPIVGFGLLAFAVDLLRG